MRYKISLLIFSFFAMANMYGQQFIDKAVIEYEVKANIKKTMGNDVFAEMIKDNIPTFKTGYYTYTFANNKSIYKFDHWDPAVKMPDYLRKSDEENIWYFDHTAGKFNMQKNVAGTNLIVEDAIPALQWKLTNESRVIAGFHCRKAVTKIFDSVYVFAFYTDEIMIPGGPVSLSGLPGMILGVTIPRLFTSWIATKVMVNNVNEGVIKPFATKKNYTLESMRSTLAERTKDWYRYGVDANEAKQQRNRFEWMMLL